MELLRYQYREVRKGGGAGVAGQGKVHPEGEGGRVANLYRVNLAYRNRSLHLLVHRLL